MTAEIETVEIAAGQISFIEELGGSCLFGFTLEPEGEACDLYMHGDEGLLRFRMTNGEEQYVRITPGILDGSEEPTPSPEMVVDVDASLSNGYVAMRNFGQRPARILAVEIADGDLVWGSVDRDSCTGKVLEPGTSTCALRVTGNDGTLRFFLDGELPQEVAVDLAQFPAPSVPGPVVDDVPRISTTTTSLGAGTTSQGHEWWPITFVNDGGRAAKISQVEVKGQLVLQQFAANGSPAPQDLCTGRTLGPNRTTPSGAVASCQIGLWGLKGTIRFIVEGSGWHDVTIDLDKLRGQATGPDDTTPPHVISGAMDGKAYGSGPEVRLGTGYTTNSITVEDPLGINRVELHLVRTDDGSNTDYLAPFNCTGEAIGACIGPQPFCAHTPTSSQTPPSACPSTPTINYGCQTSWPPPRELPANCQTTRRINYTYLAPTANWPHGTVPYNVPEGRYKMYWKVSDSRNNWQRFDVTHPTIVLDYTPPIVALSGPLAESAFTDQLSGGYLKIATDDLTSGVKSIKLFEYAGSTRLWEQPWSRPNCTLQSCDPHQYTVEYTLDPIARGWQNGPHDLDVEATDAATNTSPPRPWKVNFWKTSWQEGGGDRRINTSGEINAVRAALAPIGGAYEPSNPVWAGLVPESTVWNGTAVVAGPPGDRAIIYPHSWTYGSYETNDHLINTPGEIIAAKAALGGCATRATNPGWWAAMAPADQERVCADHTPPAPPSDIEAVYDPPSGETDLSWNPAIDPPLANGAPGSGVATYAYRYKINNGAWKPWTSTPDADVILTGIPQTATLYVELTATDVDGNTTGVVSATTTVSPTTATYNNAGAPGYDPGYQIHMEPQNMVDANGDAVPQDDEDDPLLNRGSSAAAASAAYTERNCNAGNPCGAFDGAKAARYAVRWWPVTDENYLTKSNRNYNYYGGNGGDCTNFVSQALKAGGMKFMRSHGYDRPDRPLGSNPFLRGEGSWWSYWYAGGSTGRSYVVTASWARAQHLYDHLREYGLATSVPKSQTPRQGDVIFLSHSSGDRNLSHSMIVARVSQGTVWIAQHSSPAYKNFERSKEAMRRAYGTEGSDWNYFVLRPRYAVANIG